MRDANKQFHSVTDEQMVAAARNGDDDAVDFLLEKYKGLVRKKARSLYLIGGDKDDLMQEGMIGLYKAIRSYDSGKNVSFYNFAALCITRQLYTVIKASNRQKNIPLNTYVSLYAPASGNGEENGDAFFVDGWAEDEQTNPEDIVIDRESALSLEQKLNTRLSKMERGVLQLFLSGMVYTEIAKTMGKSPKSIDNALQRIRKKLVRAIV